jgi:hypothetical protein
MGWMNICILETGAFISGPEHTLNSDSYSIPFHPKEVLGGKRLLELS